MYGTPSHHRRFLIGVAISLTVGLVLLAAIYMIAPTDTDAVATLLAGVLLFVALLLAGVAVDAYRREQLHLKSQDRSRNMGQASQQLTQPRKLAQARSSMMAGSGAVSVEPGEIEAPRIPVPVIRPGGSKVCPKCEREFQTAMEHCPFDDSLLKRKIADSSEAQEVDHLDTQRALMRCATCEREYDLGAGFCVYDGTSLTRVEEEDSSEFFDGNMVCPECDEVFDRESRYCPTDAARLLPDRPGRSHAAFASIPLSICTCCLEEYQATVLECTKCNQPLLPLLGRKTGAIPATGLGARIRVCDE